MRVLVLALVLLLGPGCFISDEIDEGNKILDQVGGKPPGAAAKAAEEPEPPARAPAARKNEPGMLDSLISWGEKQTEEPKPPPDPADAPVRCYIKGKMQFKTRWDCEARGGRAVDLPPAR